MIHKAYHPNGSPDLRNWTVQCDNHCPNTIRVLNATPSGWIVGRRENGRCYCPACATVLAMNVISWALACPNCASPDFTLGINNHGTAEFFLCNGCCSAYLATDGWHCACCGDPITPLDSSWD
ncbi:hypothetical protein AB0I81_34985 [Nonomuraea sp. NPDC050404]|uniref:hypothetical protein n=1 Tax=Nonomuraea sp. NPDC050404 TaxID=3155783 RepID=UPI0033C84E32